WSCHSLSPPVRPSCSCYQSITFHTFLFSAFSLWWIFVSFLLSVPSFTSIVFHNPALQVLSCSLTPSVLLSLSLSSTPTLVLSHPLPHALSHSLTHTLTHTHSLSHTHTHTHAHTHTHK